MTLKDQLVCGGPDDVGVAEECDITRDQHRHHLEVCGIRISGHNVFDLVRKTQYPGDLA